MRECDDSRDASKEQGALLLRVSIPWEFASVAVEHGCMVNGVGAVGCSITNDTVTVDGTLEVERTAVKPNFFRSFSVWRGLIVRS